MSHHTKPRSKHGLARRRLVAPEPLEVRALMAVITVNSLADPATDVPGQITLRDAIYASEKHTSVNGSVAGTGKDTIQFDRGIDGGTIDLKRFINDSSVFGPSAYLIDNASHNEQLTIDGQTGLSKGLTIQRDKAAAEFRLFDVAAGDSLSIDSLTLTGGVARGRNGASGSDDGGGGGGAAGMGGAIFNQGTLTLLNSALIGNQAIGGNGGGNHGSSQTPGGGGGVGGDGSGLDGGGPHGGHNAAGGFGGGGGSDPVVRLLGRPPFVTSTVVGYGNGFDGGFGGGGGGGGDLGDSGGDGGFGGGGGGGGKTGQAGNGGFGAGRGGVSADSEAGVGGDGAGLGGAVFSTGGSLKMIDCTVSRNIVSPGQSNHELDRAHGVGGGLFIAGGTGSVEACTFALNSASSGEDIAVVLDYMGSPPLRSFALTDSILDSAGSNALVTLSDECGPPGDLSVSAHNIIRGGFESIDSRDPNLGPLQDNGGLTPTMAIDRFSSAFDAGVAVNGVTTDQRGLPRSLGDAPDIGAFELADSVQRFIAQAYRDLLGRGVDADGLDYWVGQLNAGAPRSQVATQLTHTDEYFATIIKPAYQQYLGRAADAGGLAYWTAQMQAGLTDESLEAGFIGSPEYYQHAGGTDKAWVDAMYQNLLGRQPDADGERYWIAKLSQGASRASVALGFAASLEREGQLVQEDYFHYLGRTGSQADVDNWVAQFAHGVTNEDVVAGFVGSDEYYNRATR